MDCIERTCGTRESGLLLGKMSRGKMSSVCPPRHQVAIDHIIVSSKCMGMARPSRGLQT